MNTPKKIKRGRPPGSLSSVASKALFACPVGASFLLKGIPNAQASKAVSLRIIAASKGIRVNIRPEGGGSIRVFRVNAGSVGVQPTAPAGVRFARKAVLRETRGAKPKK